MKILVVGAGALGCFFGARLQLAGCAVRFGSGTHKVPRQVTLHMAGQTQSARIAAAERDFLPNLVLLCVKTWQVEAAIAALTLSPDWDGAVLTLQNGITAPEICAGKYGADRVLAGIVHGFFERDGAGSVRHVGVPARLMLGGWCHSKDAFAIPVADVVQAAGIATDIVPDIRLALWQKFLLSCAVGSVGSVLGMPIGPIRSDAANRAMLENCMTEIAHVARASGIALSGCIVADTMAFVDSFPAQATSSLQRDLMAGRPSEFLEHQPVVVELARRSGVATPVNDAICAALLPREHLARSSMPV